MSEMKVRTRRYAVGLGMAVCIGMTSAALTFTGCGQADSHTGITDNKDSVSDTGNSIDSQNNGSSQIVNKYTFTDTGYAYKDEDYQVPADLVETKDNVEYGTINDRIKYYSSTIGEEKECGVLLPAGYNEQTEYPVVYILHGNGGDHYDWNRDDSYLKALCGNMVADGSAVPAIVVMVDMWTAPKAEKEGTTIDRQLDAYDEFYKDLENDLMPFMEQNYSVATGRDATAIVGTSMGGTETLVAGFKLIDKIGFIGALAPCSGVIPIPDYGEGAWNTPVLEDFSIADKANTPYYLQLTIGDKDPWCYDSTLVYDRALTEEGIQHTLTVVEGLGHEDALWQNGLYNFFKRIFR